MAGTSRRAQTAKTAGAGSRQTSQARGAAKSRAQYVQGNAVRKLDVQREMKEPPRKKISNSTRKNREKAFYMNLPYVMFLASALVVMGIVLAGYIRLQSDITRSVEHISKLESELNELKLSNDEEYSRITSSIDLEEIRRIAIGELGMRYAKEGQIIGYSTDGSDYVRQFSDFPE